MRPVHSLIHLMSGLMASVCFFSTTPGDANPKHGGNQGAFTNSTVISLNNDELYDNKPYQNEVNEIEKLQQANDLSGLTLLADDIQRTWGAQVDKTGYYALMDVVTNALVSAYYGIANVKKQDELARKYVMVTLAHNPLPLDIEARLLPRLIPEERLLVTKRPFDATAWAQFRTVRVLFWLETWRGLKKAIVPNYDMTSRIAINNVANADELKDPKLAAERQQNIDETNRKIRGRNEQALVRSILESFSPSMEQEVAFLYSQPPHDLPELKRFLDTYVDDGATKQRILDQVAKNIVAASQK